MLPGTDYLAAVLAESMVTIISRLIVLLFLHTVLDKPSGDSATITNLPTVITMHKWLAMLATLKHQPSQHFSPLRAYLG